MKILVGGSADSAYPRLLREALDHYRPQISRIIIIRMRGAASVAVKWGKENNVRVGRLGKRTLAPDGSWISMVVALVERADPDLMLWCPIHNSPLPPRLWNALRPVVRAHAWPRNLGQALPYGPWKWEWTSDEPQPKRLVTTTMRAI